MSIADFVEQTTSTTGTGTLSLDGTVSQRRTFIQGFGNGATARYVLVQGEEIETGVGTVAAGTPDTLTRTLIWSTTGSLLNLTAGTKRVYCAATADLERFGGTGLPTAGGTANARTLTHAPPVRALRTGQVFRFINGTANSGAVTLNVDGLGALAVQRGSTALVAGDLPDSALIEVLYNGSIFLLTGVATSGIGMRLLAAVDAAAVRTLIGAPLIAAPVALSVAVGAGLTLPGSGSETYNYWAASSTAAGAATGTVIAGQAAGGSVVDPGIVGQFWTGWAQRVA
jgi:hypothetical protein